MPSMPSMTKAYVLVRPNGHWVTVDLSTAILTLVIGGVVAAVARGPAAVQGSAAASRTVSTASTVASVSELTQGTQAPLNTIIHCMDGWFSML